MEPPDPIPHAQGECEEQREKEGVFNYVDEGESESSESKREVDEDTRQADTAESDTDNGAAELPAPPLRNMIDGTICVCGEGHPMPMIVANEVFSCEACATAIRPNSMVMLCDICDDSYCHIFVHRYLRSNAARGYTQCVQFPGAWEIEQSPEIWSPLFLPS